LTLIDRPFYLSLESVTVVTAAPEKFFVQGRRLGVSEERRAEKTVGQEGQRAVTGEGSFPNFATKDPSKSSR
jgi:hypothetical protein